MAVESPVKARIYSLYEQAADLRLAKADGTSRSQHHYHECVGWLISAVNAVRLVCPDSSNPYRTKTEEIANRESGWSIPLDVGELRAVIGNLLQDLDAGMLESIAARAKAETFDDFLDHGRAYFKQSRKQESGVISGVVFEDTIRQLSRLHQIDDDDKKLDTLISALVTKNVISGTKAKRARAAAAVRTSATHAKWNEFELPDVAATIEITQELINSLNT
jgi:hypothetical protein